MSDWRFWQPVLLVFGIYVTVALVLLVIIIQSGVAQ